MWLFFFTPFACVCVGWKHIWLCCAGGYSWLCSQGPSVAGMKWVGSGKASLLAPVVQPQSPTLYYMHPYITTCIIPLYFSTSKWKEQGGRDTCQYSCFLPAKPLPWIFLQTSGSHSRLSPRGGHMIPSAVLAPAPPAQILSISGLTLPMDACLY